MKEHPILFTGEMVRAILAGNKTQTRRIVRGQEHFDKTVDLTGAIPETRGKYEFLRLANKDEFGGSIHNPYGVPGDQLWVRETHAYELWPSEFGDMPARNDWRPIFHQVPEDIDDEEFWLIPHYRATDPEPELCYDEQPNGEPCCKWRPSIHMHRWASRIQLEVTKVRVERVRDISEEDAVAEGLRADERGFYSGTEKKNRFYSKSAKETYPLLWDSINGKSHPWENNPWVWVIEFKVLVPEYLNLAVKQ